MSTVQDGVPEAFAGTVTALRAQAERLPTAGEVDLDSVVRAGRARVGKRRALGAAAVLAVVVAGVGIGSATGLGLTRTAGPPATPDASATVEVVEMSAPELYDAADAVLTDVGVPVESEVRWTVGQSHLYGEIAVAGPDGMVVGSKPVDGFRGDGYEAFEAWGVVDLTEGAPLQLRISRVDGGMSLSRSYCRWFTTLQPESPCSAVQWDGGLLIRQGVDENLHLYFIWAGGQIDISANLSMGAAMSNDFGPKVAKSSPRRSARSTS